MSEPTAEETSEWIEEFPLDFGNGTRGDWLWSASKPVEGDPGTVTQGVIGITESHWCVPNAAFIEQWPGAGPHYGQGVVLFALADTENPDDGRHWRRSGGPDEMTLTPSIACRACSHHGYIESGRWRDV